MIDIGKYYDQLGPLNSLYLLGAPALIAFMAILVSSSLWTRSKPRGFGHFLACLGAFIGAVAFTGFTSMLVVLGFAMVQSRLHLSLHDYQLTLGGLLLLNLFVSIIFADKAVTSDAAGSKRRYDMQGSTW